MTLSERLYHTDPAVFEAVLAVAAAYSTLWRLVDQHPNDRVFVKDMLSYTHAANVIPRMEKL